MGEKKSRNKRKLSRLEKKEAISGYIFISPWIIGFICITMIPLMFSLFASFTNYSITGDMEFIGLQNYIRMFTRDQLLQRSIMNTLIYVLLSVPASVIGGLVMALLLNRPVPGTKVFRTIFYLPSILSGVAVYLLWMQVLAPAGLLNTFLGFIGIEGPAWLFDPNWTKPALVIMRVWGVGGGMLLYLASLQSVPQTLYEAADMDGANIFTRFRHITLPMITPVIFFQLITNTIGAFQVFQEAFIMTNGNGGPQNSLLFFNLHMYNQAFVAFDMGYAMAMSWLLFIIIMIITLINIKCSSKWVYYEGEVK